MPKQTYQYVKNHSILGTNIDEYMLTKEEYYRIYSFYVTYSLCKRLSFKKRTFLDYGWGDEGIKGTELGKCLTSVLTLSRDRFVFTEDDDLKERFEDCSLEDGELQNVSYERFVIGKTSEDNNYLRLFHRIRNGLAHGKFKLRYSEKGEKMMVIQDDDCHNVTARIVLKLSTIMKFIEAIDINFIV